MMKELQEQHTLDMVFYKASSCCYGLWQASARSWLPLVQHFRDGGKNPFPDPSRALAGKVHQIDACTLPAAVIAINTPTLRTE